MCQKIISAFLIITIFIISISGCGFFSKEVESIVLSGEDVHLEVGDVHQITAKILPEDATDKEITWISSNESVATVKEGNILALADGDTKITAKAKNGVTSEIFWVFVDTPTAFDLLNQEEKSIYYTITSEDVLYQYFKEPSSVTVRDVQKLMEFSDNGEEIRYGGMYYMEISALNGFGGNTTDKYIVSGDSIVEYIPIGTLTTTPIDGINMTRINKALKEYFEDKGW